MPFGTWGRGRVSTGLSATLIAAQAALIVPLAFGYGSTVDELAHLAAGVTVGSFGRFDLYSVNPPLVKGVAALPFSGFHPETDWTSWNDWQPGKRGEWKVGERLLLLQGQDGQTLLALARLAVLPLVLVGGVACFLWGRDLAGPGAGLIAQALYTFCPNMLGNGALITPDAAAASLGVVAGYAFWRWLERPSWSRVVTAGIALGLVELTKFTWLILFPLWPMLWLVRRWLRPQGEVRPSFQSEAGQLSLAMGIALLVIHAGYGFDRPLWKLGEPTFVSVALAGVDSPADGGEGGNRFRGTWLGELPVPLPQMLVRGVDLQKLDFDEGGWGYMAGEWKFGGWHEFYLYAALVKLPLGTLALIVLALFAPPTQAKRHIHPGPSPSAPLPRERGVWCEIIESGALGWIAVLAPGLAVFVLVSGETGFTRFFRYALPALPFAFVWAGRCATLTTTLWGRLLVGGCLAATIASSLWVWPHSLSYFNEAAGGPANGWKHLLDANIDWGQDLPALAAWQKEHPEATPFYLATYDQLVPELYGLKYDRAPSWPAPGWYAVGLTELHKPESRVKWLRDHEPVDRIGYSILIFHVPPETRNLEPEDSR
ncbi:MAG: glycosyltransferase family 39 protein [Planctomycetota bacterium]|nr:glycosyltransferase family 39 protein [Planctomycetota bacterium]